MKKRNVIAKDLRTAKYRPRIVKSKDLYTRKVKHKQGKEEICKSLEDDFYIFPLFCLKGEDPT